MRCVLVLVLLWPTLALAQPSTRASDWTFEHSPGMASHPVQQGAGWAFQFPVYNGPLPCANDQACPGVHYLTTGSGSLTGVKSITVDGRIGLNGPVQFNFQTEPSNLGKTPANFHLYIQEAGDNLTGKGKYEFYRWWSNPVSVKLQAGPFHATVPLRPDQWSSVFGKKGNASPAARAGFAQALAHAAKVGMTFSGGNTFGHGVNIRGGKATMAVTHFRVDR